MRREEGRLREEGLEMRVERGEGKDEWERRKTRD